MKRQGTAWMTQERPFSQQSFGLGEFQERGVCAFLEQSTEPLQHVMSGLNQSAAACGHDN